MRHQASFRRSFFLLGLFLGFSLGSFGAEPSGDLRTSPTFENNEMYLLEQSLKSFRIVKAVRLSRRVYLKKTVTTGEPQYFMSNGFGKMDATESFLLSTSIVRGDRIGGSKERFYELTAEGKWRRAEGPESYVIQDDTKAGRHHEEFPAPDDSGSEE